MRSYRVEGAAVQISTATVLVLSAAQLASRKRQVKELKKLGKDAFRVEAQTLLTFKIGEVIGLPEIPKQARQHLVDLDAAADAERAAALEARDAERAAAQQARETLAARDKFVGEARKAFAGSTELQGKYADADAYIAALDAEQAQKALI